MASLSVGRAARSSGQVGDGRKHDPAGRMPPADRLRHLLTLRYCRLDYWGSVEKCFEMGTIHPTRDLRELTLTQLRTCLFCLYRVLDHAGGNLGPDDLPRAQALLAEIRDRVRRRLLD